MEPVIKDIKIKEPVLRQLTERQYLGDGYNHRFINNKTGEIIFVPCSQEEYDKLGKHNGHLHNPTLAGHTWICSEGGTVMVDNPDGVLKEDEFVVVGEKVFARISGVEFEEQWKILPPEAVTGDNKLDITIWQ